MWLAVQFPEGMFAVWHWELPNGARIYTDGCFAPAGDGPPVPVVDFHHDLHWVDGDGKETSYGRDGDDVTGIAGHVESSSKAAGRSGSMPKAGGRSATGRSAAG